MLPVTFADIEAAAERIAGFAAVTPALPAEVLSERSGAHAHLKLETRQRTGSFKDRGAANRLLTLDEDARRAGVIAMSAGNHAQAVALQSSRFGIPATIVMPESTPFTKVRRTEQLGARVVLAGETLYEAAERAAEIREREGLTLIHPYDDAGVIAGQGTVGLEFLQTFPDLDVLLVPVGGGGLISGVAVAAKHLQPKIEIVAVQTEAYPALKHALAGTAAPTGTQTIAEGIAVKAIGKLNLEIARALVSDVLLVGEDAIESAIHFLLEEEKLLAEGAGATGVAALLENAERFRGLDVGIVITGGNIDTGLLATVIERRRRREGRVVRMRVEIADKPGALAEVASIVASCGANILDVTHQRLLHDVPSKGAGLDVTFEMRGGGDLDRIAERLRAAHYAATLLD